MGEVAEPHGVNASPTASNAAREIRSDPQRLLDDTPHLPNRKLTPVTIRRELRHFDQVIKSEHGGTDRVAFWQCLSAKDTRGVLPSAAN